jgi:hypothetical protein
MAKCCNIKTQTYRVRPPPRYYKIEEDILTQVEKTIEPLSHPYIRAM